jgi:hypothetical protein
MATDQAKPRFRRGKVTLTIYSHSDADRETVPAELIGDIAVHGSTGDGFGITHAPTGLAFGRRVHTKRAARNIAAFAHQSGIDWGAFADPDHCRNIPDDIQSIICQIKRMMNEAL